MDFSIDRDSEEECPTKQSRLPTDLQVQFLRYNNQCCLYCVNLMRRPHEMAVKEFRELEAAAGALPESTIEAAVRAMRASSDALRSVVLARSLNALAEVMAKDVRGLEEAASAPTDHAVLLRVLQRPEVLEALTADDPLAPARLRGIEARKDLLEKEGGSVSAAEIGQMLGGISPQAVNKRRKAGKLLGLPVGKNRYRYPVWQAEAGRILPGFEEVLGAFGVEDPWMRAAFFLGGNARLGGKRPLDDLREGSAEAVEDAARAYGEHVAD